MYITIKLSTTDKAGERGSRGKTRAAGKSLAGAGTKTSRPVFSPLPAEPCVTFKKIDKRQGRGGAAPATGEGAEP